MGSVFNQDSHLSYVKKDGLYFLLLGDTPIAEMDRVAIAFSVCEDGSVLRHKHGTTNSVVEWVKWAKDSYARCGQRRFADELCYVVGSCWSEAELNRMIRDNVFLKERLRGLDVGNPDRSFDEAAAALSV